MDTDISNKTGLDMLVEAPRIGNETIEFCQLTEEEYSSIYYEQMKKVGWKPIADSMVAHFILAKNTIFGLKHKGIIVATLSAAICPAFGIAYMGFFTVEPQWRGLGLGKYLWGKTAHFLEQNNYVIEFDAPVELLGYYSDLGYKILSTMTIHMLKNKDLINNRSSSSSISIQKIDDNNLALVLEYDRSIINNSNRDDFLAAWINKKHTKAICYVKDGAVIGYGVMSQYIADGSNHDTNGYILAPIYAQNDIVAMDIIQALCSQAVRNEPIYIDTLNFNSAVVRVVKMLGFEEVVRVNRMSVADSFTEHRKTVISQVYALSSHGYSPL